MIDFTCTCPPNYTGNICDVPYNPCDDKPCNNGANCSSSSNGFVCACRGGFTGPTCSVNIDDCVGVNCVNGTCHDLVAGYTCVCQTGYTGEHCQTNIDDCASDPCLHGQCRDLVSGFYCDCGKPLIVTQCNSGNHYREMTLSVYLSLYSFNSLDYHTHTLLTISNILVNNCIITELYCHQSCVCHSSHHCYS